MSDSASLRNSKIRPCPSKASLDPSNECHNNTRIRRVGGDAGNAFTIYRRFFSTTHLRTVTGYKRGEHCLTINKRAASEEKVRPVKVYHTISRTESSCKCW